MHDARVDRTTDEPAPSPTRPSPNCAPWTPGAASGPLFVEVLDAVRAPLQAEIKDVQAARALAGVMNGRNLAGRVEVSSFHDEAITEIARLVPGVRTALIGSRYHTDIVERAVAAGASTVCLNIRRLTLEIVEQARKAGLRVIGWVVNTQDHLRLARALGSTARPPTTRRSNAPGASPRDRQASSLTSSSNSRSSRSGTP
ncbi:Glycerophosphoryl diester phosphodiesterase OS=Streptomyces antimycoticus OX=68175 GN=SANT12839_015570 PE=4 SV=1 [Streptomyces antimycoticus]